MKVPADMSIYDEDKGREGEVRRARGEARYWK